MTKHQTSSFLAERLESRRLLSATSETLAIGSVLYTAQDSGTYSGGSDLYRSNLDGTNRTLLGHWQSGLDGPSNLFAYGSKLLFSADYQAANTTGAELWVSDGTSGGTKMVVDLYATAAGSYPSQFHLLNGKAVFIANHDAQNNPQLYVTDGTAAGTTLLSPEQRDGYTGGVQNVDFGSTAVAWDYSNASAGVTQRLSSDGSNWQVLYTEVSDGKITIAGFGQTPTNIAIGTTSDGMIRVTQDGGVTNYRASDITSIEIGDSFASDTIAVDPSVTVPVLFHSYGGNDTITGGGGVNTFDASGHAKYFQSDGHVVYGANVTLANDGGTVGYATGDSVTLHGSFTHIIGSLGDDTIIGTSRAETLEGGGGNDSIVGSGGGDSIDGGEGRDSITASTSQDTIVPDGTDVITNTDQDDTGDNGSTSGSDGGDTGDDGGTSEPAPTYTLSNGVLRVYGTTGDDVLSLIRSATSIKLMLNGTTNKVLASNVSSIMVYGGDGNDTIVLRGITANSRLYGEAGNDAITGSDGKDRIYGGDGDDSLAGGANHDTLYGEAGDDRIVGGDASDYLSGGAGTNVIRGEGGVDQIVYAAGDNIRGNTGDRMTLDTLLG